MVSLLGTRAERYFAAMEEAPVTSIRLNGRKNPAACPTGAGGTPVEWCETGLRLAERPRFTLDPLLHAGAYYVQEASSMIHRHIISHLTPLIGGKLRVLDLCAAPGGKTTAMIDALPEGSVVVANEYVASRASVLEENVAKWGYPDTIVCQGPAERFSTPLFDIVAVDAPCSGEGMMRKETEAVAQWSPRLTGQCAALQRDILDTAAEALKPGGYLIYSTCTFNREEDEENARYLRDTHGMEPVEIPLDCSWGILPGIDTDIPCMRFIPGFTDGEGLFVCVMRKRGEAPTVSGARRRNRYCHGFEVASNTGCEGWTDSRHSDLRKRHDRIYALSPETAAMLEALPDKVYILSAGIETAILKGKQPIPSPRLALSLGMRPGAFPTAELGLDDALAYLRRETPAMPAGTPKGFVAVTYEGLPLGFVKNLGPRANNLYPSEWRIKMQTTR